MGSACKHTVRECDNCGSEIRAYGSRQDLDTIFCSKECEKDHHRETRKCAYCGDEFEVLESVADGEKGTGKYCSKECSNEWRSENWVGDNNPLTKRREIECEQCGGTFKQIPAKIKMYEKNFCSRSCHGDWLSDNNTGESHPRWKGGKVGYGENWYEQRRKALDRDGHTCQYCGKHRSEVKRIHVHHITPRRDFDTAEESNDLDNLVTLCISCHQEWEGLYLRPDRRD